MPRRCLRFLAGTNGASAISRLSEDTVNGGWKRAMTQEVLGWIGFVMNTAPGLVIAARVRPRLMGWAFGLTAGSLLWAVAGFLANDL